MNGVRIYVSPDLPLGEHKGKFEPNPDGGVMFVPQSNLDLAETLREAANRLKYDDKIDPEEVLRWYCAEFCIDEVEVEQGYAFNEGPALRFLKDWFDIDLAMREEERSPTRQLIRFDFLHLLARMAETCENVL